LQLLRDEIIYFEVQKLFHFINYLKSLCKLFEFKQKKPALGKAGSIKYKQQAYGGEKGWRAKVMLSNARTYPDRTQFKIKSQLTS